MNNNKVLILGIGNVLWADEGFGVRAVEAFNRQYEFPDSVRLMDGGTQGIYLVQHIQQADILIVFDAIDYGLTPGSLRLVEDDEVPRFMGAKKVSLHQTGFQDVLAMAELTGLYPAHMLLIGVQPVELEDYGGSLRPQVRAQLNPAIVEAIKYLAKFNIFPCPRGTPLPDETALNSPELNLQRYEQDRPSHAEACRIGDDRFIIPAGAKT